MHNPYFKYIDQKNIIILSCSLMLEAGRKIWQFGLDLNSLYNMDMVVSAIQFIQCIVRFWRESVTRYFIFGFICWPTSHCTYKMRTVLLNSVNFEFTIHKLRIPGDECTELTKTSLQVSLQSTLYHLGIKALCWRIQCTVDQNGLSTEFKFSQDFLMNLRQGINSFILEVVLYNGSPFTNHL